MSSNIKVTIIPIADGEPEPNDGLSARERQYRHDHDVMVCALREAHERLQGLYVAHGTRLPNDIFMALMYVRQSLINHDHSHIPLQ